MYNTKFMPSSPDSSRGGGGGGRERERREEWREGEIEEYFKNPVNCAKIIEDR